MNVTTGAEVSGITSTVRPFDSSVYSEMEPTVRTYLKPGTLAGFVSSASARNGAAAMVKASKDAAMNCFMG